MLSVAIIVGTSGWRTAWQKSGVLSSLFVLGAAAQLSLIQPLWLVSIRIPTVDFEGRAHQVAGAMIALQGLAVVVLLWKQRAAIARTVVGLFTLPRLIGFQAHFRSP